MTSNTVLESGVVGIAAHIVYPTIASNVSRLTHVITGTQENPTQVNSTGFSQYGNDELEELLRAKGSKVVGGNTPEDLPPPMFATGLALSMGKVNNIVRSDAKCTGIASTDIILVLEHVVVAGSLNKGIYITAMGDNVLHTTAAHMSKQASQWIGLPLSSVHITSTSVSSTGVFPEREQSLSEAAMTTRWMNNGIYCGS